MYVSDRQETRRLGSLLPILDGLRSCRLDTRQDLTGWPFAETILAQQRWEITIASFADAAKELTMPSFVLYERLDADPAGGTWRHRTFRKLDTALAALDATDSVAYITVDGVQRYRKRPHQTKAGTRATIDKLPGATDRKAA